VGRSSPAENALFRSLLDEKPNEGTTNRLLPPVLASGRTRNPMGWRFPLEWSVFELLLWPLGDGYYARRPPRRSPPNKPISRLWGKQI
jgi:hypothetical protein